MGRMDRGTDEERRRVKTDFSLAIGEMWYGGGRRESDPLFGELKKTIDELHVFTVLFRFFFQPRFSSKDLF